MKALLFLIPFSLFLASCGGYRTPERGTWNTILRGASFGAMTESAKVAKLPLYLDAGGRTVPPAEVAAYMAVLEQELSDALRKPGIQITRIGSDALVVMVRGALISPDNPDFSEEGVETLRALSRVLARHDRTFLEISGYSDAMADLNAATRFSFDMAERVAVFMAQHRVRPVRMFVIGRGSARPISDQSHTGRQMNRRVEIRISPVVR